MTAKQKAQAEQDLLHRVVERMGRISREDLLAQLEAYAREKENPPFVSLAPGSGSVFVAKNGTKPHANESKP